MHTIPGLLVCSLVLGGCTLAVDPEPPMVPGPSPVPVAMGDVDQLYCPLERIEVVRLDAQTLPLQTKPLPAVPSGKGSAKPQSPAQLVSQAQAAARVEPSARGYHGGSGEHGYVWAPGKVFTVLLSKKQGTGIFLPPGERLVSGLYLDGEGFEVKTERAGAEAQAYDAITIRPLTDSGTVDAFLLTESGRRYLLHLVVGATGMLAVTFEVPKASSPPPGPTADAAHVFPRPAR